MSVADRIAALRASRGFQHKHDISGVVASLAAALPNGARDLAQAVALGDDCAAIPDGDGYLLFAIEGMVGDFVESMPWFAGYSGVMANVSDVYAMGGRPIAVVDALWSDGIDAARPVLAGMAAAASAYGVPIVGGHSNTRSAQRQLAVSILGRARAAVELQCAAGRSPDDGGRPARRIRGAVSVLECVGLRAAGPAARRSRDSADVGGRRAVRCREGYLDGGRARYGADARRMLACRRADRARRDPAASRRRLRSLADGLSKLRIPDGGAAGAYRRDRGTLRGARLACAVIGDIDATREVVVEEAGETAVLWDFRIEPFITGVEGGTR
jgi:hypothetical protein